MARILRRKPAALVTGLVLGPATGRAEAQWGWGLASLPTVTEVRRKRLDSGRPALRSVREHATPAIADSFHVSLPSLTSEIGPAAAPPTRPERTTYDDGPPRCPLSRNSTSRIVRANIPEPDRPNIRNPLAASSGPSSRQGGGITMSP